MIDIDASIMAAGLTACTAIAVYAFGLRRLGQLHRPFPSGAVVAFGLALVALVGAVVGPMDTLADRSLTWHMIQHLLLVNVVAPLLLLGAPVRLALGALDRHLAAQLARLLNSRVMRIITHPAFAWLQFTAVLYTAHFSGLYELALERPVVHLAEHALFLISACIFWTPLLAVAPAPHAPPHPLRLLSLFFALPMSAFLGFIFYVTQHVMYRHYGNGPAALADQAVAGAVMWVAGGLPLFAAFLWCVADWGARERRLGAAG